jgi:MFS superfamily sulfate permease-like transporter
MAATSVPQLIAYSETVGLPGYRGLSTAGPPLAIYGLSTGHPYMNAGVTAITALMTKSDLRGDAYIQQFGESAYIQLVAAYSLCIGLASIALSITPFGTVARNVPAPIRYGFKWGCSMGVLLSALPNGIFHQGGNELKALVEENNMLLQMILPLKGMLPGLYTIISCIFGTIQPWIWSLPSALMFLLGTAFIMEGGQHILPKSFPPGIDVILVTLACATYSYYTQYDGAIVGEIPTSTLSGGTSLFNGHIQLPFDILNMKQLLLETPLVQQFGGSYLLLAVSSLMFAAVNFISIMGIANGFESEDGISWNANRELFAQGTSCTMAALVGSPPVSGSLSRSLVSRMTGTTSQLACIVTALCWMYLLPYMNVMSTTPKAALSAVIVSAVLKGIMIPKDLQQLSGIEATIGWGTGIITAISTPTTGFGAGLVLHYILHVADDVLRKTIIKGKTQ